MWDEIDEDVTSDFTLLKEVPSNKKFHGTPDKPMTDKKKKKKDNLFGHSLIKEKQKQKY